MSAHTSFLTTPDRGRAGGKRQGISTDRTHASSREDRRGRGHRGRRSRPCAGTHAGRGTDLLAPGGVGCLAAHRALALSAGDRRAAGVPGAPRLARPPTADARRGVRPHPVSDPPPARGLARDGARPRWDGLRGGDGADQRGLRRARAAPRRAGGGAPPRVVTRRRDRRPVMEGRPMATATKDEPQWLSERVVVARVNALLRRNADLFRLRRRGKRGGYRLIDLATGQPQGEPITDLTAYARRVGVLRSCEGIEGRQATPGPVE